MHVGIVSDFHESGAQAVTVQQTSVLKNLLFTVNDSEIKKKKRSVTKL